VMPDDASARSSHRAPSLGAEIRIAEIVARCGNIYMRSKLSPPSQLRDAARHWLGLSLHEIADVLQRHLDDCRHLYMCGSADGLFWMVESAVRKAIEAKHPAPVQEEPAKPQRPRSRVRKLHNASGFPDAYVEGDAARALQDHAGPVGHPPALPGYERTGSISLEDD
jgi:hypothetical protein